MLVLRKVSLYVGGALLLNDADFSATPGSRIGIVGRNGSGKTHLMELLAGNIAPDAGERVVADGVKVLLVKQDLPDDDQSPLEYLRNNDPDILEAEELMSTATGNAFGRACDRLAELEEERYTTLAPKVLLGLGLTEEETNQPMKNLSGGMRIRVGIAMALIRTPDVLLLDEPTNHLDLEATQWLISYLQNYSPRCAVVIVSHDLSILKKVTTSTVHLRAGVLTAFSGDYQLYTEQLEARERQDIIKNAALEKQIDRHTEIYYRFRDLPENRAAQAVAQLKKAELKAEQLVEIKPEEPVVELDFGDPAQLGDPIIYLEDVAVGYPGKRVLSDVNISLQYGAKVGILGRNGEGKSTLIRLLVDKLASQHGEVVRGRGLKVGYFSQDSAEELNIEATVYEEFVAKTGVTKDSQIRVKLDHFGFSRDKIATQIKHLSGGEKSRLMFCLICSNSPNLIILDEPTNHLDVETREELAKAIKKFKGSILLVSHDAELHEQTMSQFWLVKEGTVNVYAKGLGHYQRELQREINMNLPASHAASSGSVSAPTGKAGKKGGKTGGNSHRFHQEASRASTSSARKKTTAAEVIEDEEEDLAAVSGKKGAKASSQRFLSDKSARGSGAGRKSEQGGSGAHKPR